MRCVHDLSSSGAEVKLHMKGLGQVEEFAQLYINRIDDLINNRYIDVGQTKKSHKKRKK